MAADPADRAIKAREALADLESMIAEKKWSAAEEQARYVKALIEQCRSVCDERTPRKPLAENKFHRGFKGFDAE